MIYVGDRRGLGLSIVRVGASVRWVGATVARWLESRVTKFQKVGFLGSFRYVGWGRGSFIRYGIYVNRVV